MKALILGGTAEATALAKELGQSATLSLAGATKKPATTPHRTGGFGGIEGLARYLAAENIDALIDATHPFASQMSRNAAEAAALAGVPLLRFIRPAWAKAPDWEMVDDLSAAALVLPQSARVFLSVGSRSVEPFLGRGDVWFLTRSIEPPPALPAHGELLLQRPPFALADEGALLKAHRITHLVSKNSGGAATHAKLEACQQLGVKVLMVERPQLPAVLEVVSVADALTWVSKIKGKL